MKLLLVDDEALTREGLMANIAWNTLGITEIYQADDGIHGFQLAQKHSPDIIISDVRMPRMDGIQMASKIRENSPDSSIIFMSGYSDKEYLKAAIKLKAVNYVEKPIDPIEVTNALKEAIKEIEKVKINQNSIVIQKQDKLSHIAMNLLYSSNSINYNDYVTKFHEIGFTIKPTTFFTTLFIQFEIPYGDFEKEALADLFTNLTLLCANNQLKFIHTFKQSNNLILHLFSNEKPLFQALQSFASKARTLLSNYGNFFLSIGKTISGVGEVYNSYNSAVILMHSSFFYDYNSILQYGEDERGKISIPTQLLGQLQDALHEKKKEATFIYATELYESLKENRSILVNHVKDFYYKLFLMLTDVSAYFRITMPESESSDTILDYVSQSKTLFELHELFIQKVQTLFNLSEKDSKDTHTIYLIKDYIGKNYVDDNLSIKTISEHVFLSSSYLCTIFKNETGKTLNQYITDYRIEKAKKLLADPRNKITDIAPKVGYNDCNYFGKSFKKIVGLSPSEFREQQTHD